MKRLFLILLIALPFSFVSAGEAKKVAILETVDKAGDVPYGVKLQVRMNLTYAVSSTPGYEGYDRVDMASIMGEQSFQRTGMVSNAQIKKLGEMTGAQYVLIAEAAIYDEQTIIITAKVLDVETGGVANSAPPAFANKSADKMQAACITLAQKLLKRGSSSYSPSYPSSSYSGSSMVSGQDFTETAWGINMKMVWVEGGEFMMGCTSEQSDCESDEHNVRRVTVDGFYIGMLEVTQAQWEAVMGTSVYQQWSKAGKNGNPSRGVGADYPMYYVSWDEAMEFCRLLSNKTGRTYTLPTEAQWEYAARGGNRPDGTKYAGSNMIDAVAWYYDNSGITTHPCGTKRANALGLYDMSGNVREWCKDWYSSSYTSYDTNNPAGPSSGSYRVIRGGGWYNNAENCRVANRNYNSPGNGNFILGFRVVCIP